MTGYKHIQLADLNLLPQMTHPATQLGERRLRSAHTTVQGLFDVHFLNRSNRLEPAEMRGQPAEEHVNILRAALVMAGASLDAVIRGSTREAVPAFEAAKYGPVVGARNQWAIGLLKQEPSSAKAILGAQNSDRERSERFLDYLVGSSLQSPSSIGKVVAALGLNTSGALGKGQLQASLGDFLEARNTIVHQLDLNEQGVRGKRNANARPMGVVEKWANAVMAVSTAYLVELDGKLATV